MSISVMFRWCLLSGVFIFYYTDIFFSMYSFHVVNYIALDSQLTQTILQ